MFHTQSKAEKETRGMVLRLERSSIHDGDGLRTVVFLKGCPLRCQWCSTPESMSPAVETAGDATYGTVMTVDEVMAEVRKDVIFYFHSGGGMTLSGGEPLVQPDFSAALLTRAQGEGINTAIETSLSVPFKLVERILPNLDTMYADFKHIDPNRHKMLCGMDNAAIRDNLVRVDEAARHYQVRLVVRIPVIPGVNDDSVTLHATGAFLANLENLDHVQLLPYHRLGVDTYRKLGRPYPLEAVRSPDAERMDECRDLLRAYVRYVV